MTLVCNVQHGVQLPRLVSQQALQVADEAVNVAFAGCLPNDVLVVVIAKTTTEFLIVHLGFVFPPAPQQSHLHTNTQTHVLTVQTHHYRRNQCSFLWTNVQPAAGEGLHPLKISGIFTVLKKKNLPEN